MALSLILYCLIFFLIINWSYIQKKRQDPDCPDRPLDQLVLFPVALGVAFTLIARIFRGIFLYQTVLFLLTAALLYWVFFLAKKK
ncbi:MAG TPA: hypothetical protein VN426_15705 [Syntrophomonadaceae bacterium]|nr:hypothetical protein [Syntrophomonadaceae bacterium]